MAGLIDSSLIADRDAPREQRHTAEVDLGAALGRARRGGVPSGRSVGMSASVASSSASSLTRCSFPSGALGSLKYGEQTARFWGGTQPQK